MMHNRPAKEKPLIDLTKATDKDRLTVLEAEVDKLTDFVTTLAMRKK